MMEFLNGLFVFPTVFFSVLLVLILLYWMMVIVGAMDVEILDAGSALEGGAEGAAEGLAEGAAEGLAEGVAEGAAEGLAEGAAEGAAEGLADGAVEGAAEGVAEGLAEGAAEAAGEAAGEASAEAHGGNAITSLLSALRLRQAPVTVVCSLIILFAWALSFGQMTWLAPYASVVLPGWVVATLVGLAAILLALPITSVAARPLGRFFVVHQAPSRRTLIGKVCTVTTGRVDDNFGQADLEDGGAGMLFQVRCDRAGLKRGQNALIVAYDKEREAFLVEPYDKMIKGKG